MDVNAVQIVLVFLVTFVAAIDQFDFLESLYQPIVTGAVIGAILGDINTGLIVGGTYQLMTIGNMPIGGAQPPNAVIGGIMAAVFACTLDMDPDMAVATAIPFALLGQYGVTLFFTLRAPLLEFFRGAAENADTKAITKWTIISECILGAIFAVIVTLFFIGGLAVGQQIVDAIPAWLNTGLSQAGNMMKFVGFAILLKIMMNRDMWGFFFMGFGLALIASNIEAIAGPALLILTLIGFGIAFWDFQQQTELKGAVADGGDFTDGI
ncbi:PTS mannose/fructose/sorbose/N-acetylgalactosamine transporter subunit IIC [Collinsella tanakaei]|uniref:PTS mannose/fructose/sorbose/N-acetylgalactosamine transporter subunit IIC n=1 Tax=Collinsella tanakaei TaxID=626935 RepID=UPI0025A31DE3|nr:PTS sugar transporter subunit IIC [Collinsella tanakaei]MDM8300851.1 PTS sugar transporter subunit IIC [Collinsella tanakaei]